MPRRLKWSVEKKTQLTCAMCARWWEKIHHHFQVIGKKCRKMSTHLNYAHKNHSLVCEILPFSIKIDFVAHLVATYQFVYARFGTIRSRKLYLSKFQFVNFDLLLCEEEEKKIAISRLVQQIGKLLFILHGSISVKTKPKSTNGAYFDLNCIHWPHLYFSIWRKWSWKGLCIGFWPITARNANETLVQIVEWDLWLVSVFTLVFLSVGESLIRFFPFEKHSHSHTNTL